MRQPTEFAPRFRLVLHALRLSRAGAASALQVDKSLVGRWAAGNVVPGDHNLSRITRLIAASFPEFTGVDWQRDLPGFAALLGLEPDHAMQAVAQPIDQTALSLKCLEMGREESKRRGSAYEGFWRTSRPSLLMRDKIFHDYGLIRRSSAGLLEVTMAGAGLGFSGWAFPLEGNLFAILDQAEGFTPLFLIFRGVPLPKATVLEGIALMAAMDAARTPASFPLFLERIGDLSGDAAADDEKCREFASGQPYVDIGEVEPHITARLFRGETGDERGLDPMFILASGLMSRGATRSGELEG